MSTPVTTTPESGRKKRSAPKVGTRIEVTWEDAQYDNEYDGSAEGFSAQKALLTELGYFIRQTKDLFIIASCHEPETDTYRRFVVILRKNLVGDGWREC